MKIFKTIGIGICATIALGSIISIPLYPESWLIASIYAVISIILGILLYKKA